MNHWKLIAGAGIGLGGLGALLVATNPQPGAFETFAIDQVKTELCPQVPLGIADQCPRLVDTNEKHLKGWIRQNTQTQNYGFFTRYDTTLSIRELIPAAARPFLALAPLPQQYRLQTIGILGRFVIYRTQSQR
jgi:hypothetical protein